MKMAKTFKDAASEEIAWFRAYSQAKANGFKYAVRVIAIPAGMQVHYFTTLKNANEFVNTCNRYTDHWKDCGQPKTIDELLKQCWS